MYPIRLPNGNLLVPESAVDHRGGMVGDAYVEIGPADPEYARLAPHAVTESEMERRRRQWREGDEALRREFEGFLAARRQARPEPGEEG